MSVFNKYSRYYDVLYRDKSYDREVDFVEALAKKHCSELKTILELGCGTGGHAAYLAQRGYDIDGIDLSEEMLRIAEEKYKPKGKADGWTLNFFHGDIRNVRLNKEYDAILSLFHVISYQTGNDDLLATFNNVRQHLRPGGVFVFDCWYGPGVLTDPPVTRVKEFDGETFSVTRIAEPVMHPTENVVDVNYRVLLMDKATGGVEEIKELHRMRYLFIPEVDLMLQSCGLKIVEKGKWLSDEQAGLDCWNAFFVCTHA